MDIEAYRKRLGRLPIIRPTLDDATEILPHLTERQIRETFLSKPNGVAIPPVFVTGPGCQTVWWQPSATNVPDQLEIGPFKLHCPYMREAEAFAERNAWGPALIERTWQDAYEVHIIGPTGGSNVTVHARLYVASAKSLGDLSRTEPEDVDKAVLYETTDPLMGAELVGFARNRILWNCAGCGATVNPRTGCPSCIPGLSCGASPDRPGPRLTPKMFAFVEASIPEFASYRARIQSRSCGGESGIISA